MSLMHNYYTVTYLTVIGPCAIFSFHMASLTKESQMNQIESVQKRIILSYARDMPYSSTLFV